jgi:AcrR family transcriptional regulator
MEMWNGVAAWYRPDGRMPLARIGQSYAELTLAALGAGRSESIGWLQPRLSAFPVSSPANRILDAATLLIAQRGYHGVSLRDLARAADVPSSTIYHYFSSKEDVLYSIMKSTMVELLDVVRQAYLTASDPVGQLEAVVVAHVRFHATHRDAAFVSDAEVRSLTGHAREVILTMRLEYEALFRSILAAGITAGVFRISDIGTVVFGLIRMCSSVASWCDARSDDLDHLAAHYAELSLAMVHD